MSSVRANPRDVKNGDTEEYLVDAETLHTDNKRLFGDKVACCPQCDNTVVRSKRSGSFLCVKCDILFQGDE
tara:strand:- start:207 stop:419 length:213 start_codon:yes stop_codon:yes gene_type:complete